MTAGDSTGNLESSSRTVTDILLLAGFCGFLFFFGLAYFGLVGADEPRYAQVAREMLARNDWITPTLGGKPWLEKPVLYYWQAMAAYRIFGVSDWAARLPSAVDAALMVVAVYMFLRRLRPGFHLDGALITASSAAVIGFGRAASTDMPLAAMFTIAMLAWYAWYENQSRTYLALSFLFLGLAVLAKGPIAILLAFLILVLFATGTRDVRLLRQTFWIPGIAIFLAVVLPWYLAVQIKSPQFFRVFILEHNFARFGTDLYHHREPFWYYLPVLIIASLPWTVFLILAISKDISIRMQKRRHDEPHDNLSLFLLVWLIVPVVFFSLSQSKLPGYILPAVPAGSLLVAEYVRTHVNKPLHLRHILIHAIVVGGLLIPALAIQYILLQRRIPWAQIALPLAFAALCTIAIAITLKAAGLRILRFATLIPIVLAVGVLLRAGSPVVNETFSARPLANDMARLQPALGGRFENMQIAVFEVPRETEFGLSFYLNRPIPRYERQQIPFAEHLVITPSGSQTIVASAVPGRRVSYLGNFVPQALDYFWVEAKK